MTGYIIHLISILKYNNKWSMVLIYNKQLHLNLNTVLDLYKNYFLIIIYKLDSKLHVKRNKMVY